MFAASEVSRFDGFDLVTLPTLSLSVYRTDLIPAAFFNNTAAGGV